MTLVYPLNKQATLDHVLDQLACDNCFIRTVNQIHIVRLKSHNLSELTNNSISISIQKICLALRLMATYMKCLTFAHGILSLLKLRSTPFLTITTLVQHCCLTLVHILHCQILTKVPLPFTHTELLFTSLLLLNI